MCMSPIHMTSSQLISSEIFPVPMIKALLYPGAIVNGLATNMTFPKWDNVLDLYNLTNVKDASAVSDLQRLEVLAGTYFSVAGAFVGLLKPGSMGMFGSLLLVWGLVKEGILKKLMNTDPSSTVYVDPTMVIAMICALYMINYNLKKATRAAPTHPIAKPLMSSSKSKLNSQYLSISKNMNTVFRYPSPEEWLFNSYYSYLDAYSLLQLNSDT
ncbi:uncharacterized protein LOC106366766 [Brassica napus]|uniref:uncharacterized protein LOC106366766 n=1 Tax=Brassica napus TaxID=3708 RepID=UPI0006AAC491|nr:uncharacterized protein LOC106366766 [Brassica napus]